MMKYFYVILLLLTGLSWGEKFALYKGVQMTSTWEIDSDDSKVGVVTKIALLPKIGSFGIKGLSVKISDSKSIVVPEKALLGVDLLGLNWLTVVEDNSTGKLTVVVRLRVTNGDSPNRKSVSFYFSENKYIGKGVSFLETTPDDLDPKK
jgi:hypothetical protein